MATRLRPVPTIDQAPRNPLAWLRLAQERLPDLPPATRAAITTYELVPNGRTITFFASDVEQAAGDMLERLAQSARSPDTIAAAVGEIVKRKTIAQCAWAHRAGPYFSVAEATMAVQWERTIWPIVHAENFERTVDLACGHGRNTEFLRRHAKQIDLVDVNPACIAACRERFGDAAGDCSFRYHVNDGTGLDALATASVTFVYSWDSMVHFEKSVVRDYVHEIARVLEHGGSAFLHHSNLGAVAPDSDWARNHGSRSDMSANLMIAFAGEAGLMVKFQRLSGTADGWGMDDLDALTLLGKP